MPFKLNLRTKEAKTEFHNAVADSMRELMAGPVKSEAQILCPRAEHLHKGHEKHTADTIGIRVRETKKGIGGSIFTQSGVGAYIEAGTKNMAARPFLMPAFLHHAQDLVTKIALKIKTKGGLDKSIRNSD